MDSQEEMCVIDCQPLENTRPAIIKAIPMKKSIIFPTKSNEFPPNIERIIQITPQRTAIPEPLKIGFPPILLPCFFSQ